MFKNLVDLGSSLIKVTDSTIGLATKPLSDGANLISESIEDILRENGE